ncbi:APC family permease [Aneurinibacillus sp. Ricciae_BoGa-3]|uniref:APC family permease n=1 Tax=Aneurinibacillus sp. Ricciae_BoGa-3 TaxID=3022697 RepID=UPI0023413756|nr:APC family permease [Aneurinibacillus sp. Ricciae_BoGa-3]WCK54229.1 APC family permease [Aneurinibacillus sp. Ricciae_BoGa-3]
MNKKLTYIEAMAISVAIMAPTAAMALNGSLAAGTVGHAVPLTFLLAMITIGLVSYTFIQFNRHFAHSGSVYAFTSASLCARTGFLSGWTLLLTYLLFTAASTAEIGAFMQSFLELLGVKVGWLPIALVSGILIWFLAFLEVRISARVLLIFEGLSILLIAILAVVIIAKGGAAHHLTAEPFTLGDTKLSAIGLAGVFAFLSFAGFEGASSLAEETQNPKKAIPLAIGSAVFFTGIFYLIVSYAQSIGFGMTAAGIKTFAGSSAPLADLSNIYVSHGFAVAIMLGAALSGFSSALGTATTGSRLLFSMGRDGLFHASLGKLHPKFESPHIALSVVMIIAFILLFAMSSFSGIEVFGYLGTIAVLGLLLAYLVTTVGGIYYFTRIKTWKGPLLIVPILSILALGYALYSNVYPVPDAPYKYFPYIVLSWIVLGFLYSAMKRSSVSKFHQQEIAELEEQQ